MPISKDELKGAAVWLWAVSLGASRGVLHLFSMAGILEEIKIHLKAAIDEIGVLI